MWWTTWFCLTKPPKTSCARRSPLTNSSSPRGWRCVLKVRGSLARRALNKSLLLTWWRRAWSSRWSLTASRWSTPWWSGIRKWTYKGLVKELFNGKERSRWTMSWKNVCKSDQNILMPDFQVFEPFHHSWTLAEVSESTLKMQTIFSLPILLCWEFRPMTQAKAKKVQIDFYNWFLRHSFVQVCMTDEESSSEDDLEFCTMLQNLLIVWNLYALINLIARTLRSYCPVTR